MNIHVADNAREAARMLLRNMLAVIRQPSGAGGEGDTVNVAFSGGSTPAILFDVWVEEYCAILRWCCRNYRWTGAYPCLILCC